MLNRISEVIDPALRSQLTSLANTISKLGSPFLSFDILKTRLLNWIDGDDRAQFVLTNYQDYGFYYFDIDHKQEAGGNITLNNHAGREYMTWYVNLRNLFTDVIVLSATIQSHNGGITSASVHNAGFQPFQLPSFQPSQYPNYSFVGNVQPTYSDVPNLKIIYTKAAQQFTQTITPGEGGGGFTTTGVVPGENNSNNNDNSSQDFLSQYGLYIGLGLLAFIMFNQRK